MEETVKDRLTKFRQYKKLGQGKFEKLSGLSNGYLTQLRKAPGSEKLQRILCTFPELNRTWLLTGEGEMLVQKKEESLPVPKTSYTTGRPYYNVDFIGGFDLIINDQTILPEYNIDFAPYNQDGVFWCNITGNSMQPKISHGDIIALKEVSDWQSYLTMGEIYAIVTTNELRTVKIVRKGTSDDVFRLIPINMADFDEQEISKTMIMRVFEVLGCMKRI